jgi:hypothetical protein
LLVLAYLENLFGIFSGAFLFAKLAVKKYNKLYTNTLRPL